MSCMIDIQKIKNDNQFKINLHNEFDNLEKEKGLLFFFDDNLKFNTGIYVVQIDRNSSAYNSGLREKDVIIQIDNINLEKMCDLRRYIYTKNS